MIKKRHGGAVNQAAGGRSRSRSRSRNSNSRTRSNSTSGASTSSNGSSVETSNSRTITVETVATVATTSTKSQKPSQLQKQQEELLKVLSSQLTDDQNAALKEILLLQHENDYNEFSAAVMENKDKTAQKSENEQNKTARAKHEDLSHAGGTIISWKDKIETKIDTMQKDMIKIKQDISLCLKAKTKPQSSEGMPKGLSSNDEKEVLTEPPLLFSNTNSSSKCKLFVASVWPPMKDGKHQWTVRCLQPSSKTTEAANNTTNTADENTTSFSTTEERVAAHVCSLGVTTVFDSKNNKQKRLSRTQKEQNDDVILGENFPGWAYQNDGTFCSKVSFRLIYWAEWVWYYFFGVTLTEGLPRINPGDIITFVLDFTEEGAKKSNRKYRENDQYNRKDGSRVLFEDHGSLYASINGGALFPLASRLAFDSEFKGGFLPAASICGLEVEFFDYQCNHSHEHMNQLTSFLYPSDI